MLAGKKLKNGKACGLDGVLNEMIKYGHFFLPSLEKLFNLMLSFGVYPKKWGDGYLIPIYKRASPSDPNNYRGITINSSLCKLFNSILNNRLVSFLKDKKILNYEQRAQE